MGRINVTSLIFAGRSPQPFNTTPILKRQSDQAAFTNARSGNQTAARRMIEKTLTSRGDRSEAYLLGLLAMIKCSICSYQCDN